MVQMIPQKGKKSETVRSAKKKKKKALPQVNRFMTSTCKPLDR
jgi:hypothetical protein